MSESKKHLSELFGLVQFENPDAEPPKKKKGRTAEQSTSLGAQALEEGQNELAIEHFERALEQSNGQNAQKIDLANALELAGREDESEALLVDVCQADSDHVEARLCLALMYRRQGKISAAIDQLERAIAKEPNRADLHFHLAEIARDARLMRQAIRSAERAALIDPANPFYHLWLGELLIEFKQFELALEPLKQAVGLSPGDEHAVFQAAVAFWATGRIDEAVKAVEMAIKLDADNQFYLAALQRMRSPKHDIKLDEYDESRLVSLLELVGA